MKDVDLAGESGSATVVSPPRRLQLGRAFVGSLVFSFGLMIFLDGLVAMLGGPRSSFRGLLFLLLLGGVTQLLAGARPQRRLPRWALAVVLGIVLGFGGAALGSSPWAKRDLTVQVSSESGVVEQVCLQEECVDVSGATARVIFTDVPTRELVEVEVTLSSGYFRWGEVEPHWGCVDLRLVDNFPAPGPPVRVTDCS